tara:strand:+ start:503 stop:973 length:471 start_codon:yes stop_codon:yes gene_type:complete
MPQNRKFQNFIANKFMADDAVGAAELINDSVGNAALAAEALKFAKFTYDFSSAGGDVSSITLGTLPDKAIVVRGHAEVETAVTSGGSASVALGVVANTDAFVGATAKGSLTLNAVLATSNDLPLKMSGDTPVLATITTAALTAGKINLFVEYYEGA